MEQTKETQIRKRNMKLFPTYKKLSWDYLFFYTINFLFLTQVKQINPADVVLIDSFYYLFAIFSQIPATFIIEFLGRKNSIIVGNILSCMYMVVIIFSQNLFNLVIAEILSALSFAIKESAEPSLLSESIPPTKLKSAIFAKLNSKGMSSYYILNAISTILAGILYEVNPYIPICLSLTTLVLVTILSTQFIEPVQREKKEKVHIINQFNEVKESFTFVLKSERVKSLILFSSIMTAILSILNNYEVSMMEDLEVSARYLGILFAVLGVMSSIGAKNQERFHNLYRNKSLTILGTVITLGCILGGAFGILAKEYKIVILIIVILFIVRYLCSGIYYTIIEKYLSNFTNEEIDTKIFTANNFLRSIMSAIFGIMASFLLDRMETAYCMIAIGALFVILMILTSKFMKSRVGLKVEEYPKDEVKYDKLKEISTEK